MYLLKLLIITLIVQFQSVLIAQEVNSLDTSGKRHGIWQKKYPESNQLRYEGQFTHGKETGTFKFYDKDGGHPTAIKIYTPNTAIFNVSYYTTTGKLVSEGKMKDRERIGNWKTYHQDGKTIMIEESYINGQLDGERIVYFISSSVAQKEPYVNGKKHGVATYYAEDGTLLKELTYRNDMLDGPSKMYNGLGIIEVKGSYKQNRKHGYWTYFKNGKVDQKIKFPQNKIGVQ